MASFSTWLITIFMVMFWIFRAIVALCTQFSIDLLGIQAYDLNHEIIIAFVTVLCVILVVKRKLIGALLYLLLYGTYFGEHFFTNLVALFENKLPFTTSVTMNLFCDFIAIVLVFFVLFDMLIDKQRKANPVDKKTDWYFKNKKYDEELNARDKREDTNHYKYY